MINPKTQQFMAGRMHARVRSSSIDHSPMYTATDLVVEVILEAAQATVARERTLLNRERLTDEGGDNLSRAVRKQSE